MILHTLEIFPILSPLCRIPLTKEAKNENHIQYYIQSAIYGVLIVTIDL